MMTTPPLLLICLLIGTGCLVVMTVVVALLARDVRAAARRMSELLPHGDTLIQHSQQVVECLQAVLAQTDEAMRQVRVVTARACAAAMETLDAVAMAKQTAAVWVEEHFGYGLGNGTGSRRSRRRSRSMDG